VLSNKTDPKRADFGAAFAAFFANIGRWKGAIETRITANFHFIGSPNNGIPKPRQYTNELHPWFFSGLGYPKNTSKIRRIATLPAWRFSAMRG